jgi:ElaB/YqjD/DUF883 family membrane-anchored ribosome-binding protein
VRNGAMNSSMKHLRRDLHAVARDAEQLLRATANVSGDRIQDVRDRTQKTVRQAFDHLYDDRLQRRVRRAARNTDSYVRDNPWGIIGAAAGIGLIIGLLSRRDY